MKKEFLRQRKLAIEELKQHFIPEILTEAKLAQLPVPIQKYFLLSGFVNKPIALQADFIWKKSAIKLNPKRKWAPLTTLQFNSVNPIMRMAFMKMHGIPFSGKDSYMDGTGTMKGKILNLFQVINGSGPELTQSALITSFAEFMMLSGYAFQDYIEWETVSGREVQATLSDNGMIVKGLFYFDKEGKFEKFETNDRYYSEGKGDYIKKPYRIKVQSYRKINGFYVPEKVCASWILKDMEFEYFKGTFEYIRYNPSN